MRFSHVVENLTAFDFAKLGLLVSYSVKFSMGVSCASCCDLLSHDYLLPDVLIMFEISEVNSGKRFVNV